MTGKRVLVTGASGFIGLNLVRQLLSDGDSVTCLVRESSDIRELKKLDCQLVIGDLLQDGPALETAVPGKDVIYHLAARTKATTQQQLIHANIDAFENLLNECQRCDKPPVVIFVSSLAAVGPSSPDRPHVESDVCRPISNYGISKAEAESLAQKFCSRVPISIVRPPIVLGPGDREGLMLFKPIDSLGLHVIPSWRDHHYSVIHVGDLVKALIAVANSGQRLDPTDQFRGIYFAAADEILTYRDLGIQIGRALGRTKVRILRTFAFLLWSLASINSLLGRLTGKPRFLDRDKAREATAGSWTCSNEKLRREVGFSPSSSLSDQLQQTAQWYRAHGWLKSKPSDLKTCPKQTDAEVLAR